MESDWVLVSKCEKALKGTALLLVELVALLLEVAEEVPAASAFTGEERVLAEGVKRAEVVRALEPAEVAPLPVELAGAPEVPAAELDCIESLFRLSGSNWNCGWLSRMTWY